MLKVLIISYYFPPLNHIAGNRAEAFAKYFPKYGIEPTIVTRHWTGEEKGWESYFAENKRPPKVVENDGGKTIYLPFTHNRYKDFRKLGKLFHQGYIFGLGVTGTLQPELEIYKDFYPFLREYVKDNRFDYLMATSPPVSAIKIVYRLGKEFGIPTIVDFRDIWNLAPVRTQLQPGNFKESALNFIQERHLKKWMADTSLISAVNPAILEECRRLFSGKSRYVLATNGFEASHFKEFVSMESNNKFTFSVVGTLYSEHDLSPFLNGLKIFLRDKTSDDVQLNFVGVAAIDKTVEILKNNLSAEFLNITDRVSREEAIIQMKKAHVLYYAGWKGLKGITPAKIFDYIAAGRNVLIAPGDDSAVDAIITETNAGKITNSAEEFARILNDWFYEWKKNGRLEYHGNWEKTKIYTRENQTRILAEAILDLNHSEKK